MPPTLMHERRGIASSARILGSAAELKTGVARLDLTDVLTMAYRTILGESVSIS